MKKFWVLVLTIFSTIILANNVSAEEDTTCNYNSKAYLNKLAYNVTANYQIRRDDSGKYYFEISIYNITEDIYIKMISTKNNVTEETQIIPQMTNNGIYTFKVDDIESIITYDLIVRTYKYGCTHDLRKLTLIKPKRNDISDLEICKNNELEGYTYCQEWITRYFTETREEVIKKIETHYKKKTTTTTTRCISCEIEDENSKTINKVNNMRLAIIIGLSVGILLDSAFIVYLFIRLKRYSV